jgi:hypothetical protein
MISLRSDAQGEVIPGPFQAYMATGPRAGMFHAPVCEYDLNPSLLVFLADGVEFDAAVLELLKKMDGLIAKYPQAKLGATAIVLGDGGYRKAIETALEDKKVTDLALTVATLSKEERDAKLKDIAKKADLQHVTLGFAPSAELEKYPLDAKADVNVLFLHQHKIIAKNAYPKGGLGAQDIEQILGRVETTAKEVIKVGRKL